MVGKNLASAAINSGVLKNGGKRKCLIGISKHIFVSHIINHLHDVLVELHVIQNQEDFQLKYLQFYIQQNVLKVAFAMDWEKISGEHT